MASTAFDSFLDDVARGNIDLDTDTFYVMATDNSYAENKGTHTKRSDITNEISGTGYTAGGQSVTVTVTKDTTAHTVTITFGGGTWATSTLTARKFVYYKRRGGASSADELCMVNVRPSDVTTVAGTLTLSASTIVIPTAV